MYTIRNNPKNSATMFENVVFAVDIVLFSFFAVMAFIHNEILPAAEFLCFVLFGIICLYFNNRIVAYVYDDKIVIRKVFKKYKYKFTQIKSVDYDVRLLTFKIKFDEKTFKIPSIYQNVFKLMATLKMANNYFATEEGIERLKSYFKKHASKTDYVLTPVIDKKNDLFTTKIGGIPYWDFAMEYPIDEDGNKMHLLCQLNFEECKFEDKLLPKDGILQFFISSNAEFYGMSFVEPTLQQNFRIVYHKTIDKSADEEKIKKIIPTSSEIISSPISNCMPLEFSQSVSYMKTDDYQFGTVLKNAVNEIMKKEEELELDIFDVIGSESENINASSFYKMVSESENHVLGFPEFIQGDVRDEMSKEEASYYDTVLLHLETSSCGGKAMCWGDAGCANFLINSEALKNCDFSKVYYTWDCY